MKAVSFDLLLSSVLINSIFGTDHIKFIYTDEGDILTVYHNGLNTYLPVCYSSVWARSWSNFVCSQANFGQEKYGNTSFVNVSMAPASIGFYIANHRNIVLWSSIREVLYYTSQCLSGKVVAIKCTYDECGQSPKASASSSLLYAIRNAADNSWPWHVVVNLTDSRNLCGGVLLDKYWVITSAFCVRDYKDIPEKIQLYFGINNVSDAAHRQHTIVRNVIINENLNVINGEPIGSDIALLQLRERVNYSFFVRPVCVPPQAVVLSYDSKCYITGYGLRLSSEADELDSGIYLQETRVQTISDRVCYNVCSGERYPFYSNIMICAGRSTNSYLGAFVAENGGILVCNPDGDAWVLTGIYSCDTCKCENYNVLLEVSMYLNWLSFYIPGLKIKSVQNQETSDNTFPSDDNDRADRNDGNKEPVSSGMSPLSVGLVAVAITCALLLIGLVFAFSALASKSDGPEDWDSDDPRLRRPPQQSDSRSQIRSPSGMPPPPPYDYIPPPSPVAGSILSPSSASNSSRSPSPSLNTSPLPDESPPSYDFAISQSPFVRASPDVAAPSASPASDVPSADLNTNQSSDASSGSNSRTPSPNQIINDNGAGVHVETLVSRPNGAARVIIGSNVIYHSSSQKQHSTVSSNVDTQERVLYTMSPSGTGINQMSSSDSL